MQAQRGLEQRYGLILHNTGLILLLGGLLMLTPLIALAAWPNEAGDALSFILPAACLFLIGGGLWLFLGRDTATLTVQEGGIIVLAS